MLQLIMILESLVIQVLEKTPIHKKCGDSDLQCEELLTQSNDWLWKMDTTPKVKNFIWRMTKDGLATSKRLAGKGVVVTNHVSCATI